MKIIIQLNTFYFAKIGKEYTLTPDDIIKKHVLTENEHKALNLIRKKHIIAKQSGMSIRQWLNQNIHEWIEISKLVLGHKKTDAINDCINKLAESDEAIDPAESISNDSEIDESDDENELLLSNVSYNEDEEADCITDSEDLEADTLDENSESNTDETTSDESDNESVFITHEHLAPARKSQRSNNNQLKQQERQVRKLSKHGGKDSNRAGITNRSMARNKPLAMLKQKREIREKNLVSAQEKMQKLRNHATLLKKQKHQKYRRI